MENSGWKPRCALRVGVVGNRRLHGREGSAAAALHDVWKTLIDSITKIHGENIRGVSIASLFDGQVPRLAVLSSLAAGADQIGAKAAMEVAAARTDIRLELEAILPFGEEDYPGREGAPRPEFTANEAEELRQLADAATQVIRLDGDYTTEESRRSAYRQARDLLLQNSDIVVATYDPDAPGGDAGTLETVRLARESNSPVIAVQLGMTEVTIAVARSTDKWNHDPNWQQAIENCVREQLVLSELFQDDASLDHAVDALRIVAGSQDVPWLCSNRLLGKIFGQTWASLRWMSSFIGTLEAKRRLREAEECATVRDDITLEPYAPLYDRASDLANSYMRTYRGAFVLSYFFAAFAVATAVVMMLAIILVHLHPPVALAVTLCSFKIAIIVSLLVLERAGRKLRLHEWAVDFRFIAELVRPMQWLSAAGVYPPAVDLPLHSASDDLRRSWMAWLVRAAARSSPSVATDNKQPKTLAMTKSHAADVLDQARTQWMAGQVGYHVRTHARMEAIGEGLERCAKALLWTVLAAAIVTLVLESCDYAPTVAHVLGALAAILPAFIAALIGVAFQSEAKRLAQRSEAMHRALLRQQGQLADLATRLRNGQANHADAAAILKRISSITIAEAADWKILYQVHEIRAS